MKPKTFRATKYRNTELLIQRQRARKTEQYQYLKICIASTALNEEGFPPDVIEAALAHVDKNEVRRAYNRSDYLEQRRPMMQWWAYFVKKADSGRLTDVELTTLKLTG